MFLEFFVPIAIGIVNYARRFLKRILVWMSSLPAAAREKQRSKIDKDAEKFNKIFLRWLPVKLQHRLLERL